MAKHRTHRTHRTHSIAFKRRIVQEYLAGETLHGLTVVNPDCSRRVGSDF